MPNIADVQWGEDIFKYYGVPEREYRGRMGYGYGYVSYYGSPTHPVAGRDDPYKKDFDSKTIKTISGQVIKVSRDREPGMGMEMRLTVFTDKKEVLPVYLGPAFYIVGSEQAKPFKIGDYVTVTGSQITVRDESFMLATTVKRGNEVLRLRDKDGNPEWIGWKIAGE